MTTIAAADRGWGLLLTYAGILLGARSLGVTLFIAPALVAAGTHVGPAQAAQEEEFEQAEPEVGDLLHHFAFGLCEVVGASGDRLKLRDPGEGGRVREISTERLKITGPTLEGDKRLFTLIRKG